MIKNRMFLASITIYSNHITTYCSHFVSFQNAKESMKTLPEMELVTLLTGKYGHNGDFIYKIEVKQ